MAEISDCGRYRYTLTREWLLGEGLCLFIMLNPSTADAEVNDATIDKITKFAQRWGYQRLAVGNVYALRSTDPEKLKTERDPVGEGPLKYGGGSRFTYDNMNDEWLRKLLIGPDRPMRVIGAWGTKADPRRAATVCDLLAAHFGPFDCLGVNKGGSPKHPLYLLDSTDPISYDPFTTPKPKKDQGER